MTTPKTPHFDEFDGWREMAKQKTCSTCFWWLHHNYRYDRRATFHTCTMVQDEGHGAVIDGEKLYTRADFYCAEWMPKLKEDD